MMTAMMYGMKKLMNEQRANSEKKIQRPEFGKAKEEKVIVDIKSARAV
ncbi:MAG: hypothetical protein K6B41_06990 [Butyrivibrio sp.]|nr:hypothetical protein [Butyrivibrio sp.]